MKNVNETTESRGKFATTIAVLGAAALFLLALAAPPPASAATTMMTQLEYLQWMTQLCGETMGSTATAADYVAWARGKGMNPTGGWQPGSILSKDVLAQTLVQILGVNGRKVGQDYARILERTYGIVLPASSQIGRTDFVPLIDNLMFNSPLVAKAGNPHSPWKGNNGVGNGTLDGPPPGNPPPNDPPGTGPGDPGNQGGVKRGQQKH